MLWFQTTGKTNVDFTLHHLLLIYHNAVHQRVWTPFLTVMRYLRARGWSENTVVSGEKFMLIYQDMVNFFDMGYSAT
ncbi:hypothetical protein OAG56_01435 [Mariniblastus sp.]|jgi:hypothetical protein|nr:hypothetical protein [Mariniblastus sp.]MDB4671809.1 hypothetical protein [Pirellulaceae bacterium]MDB4756006.1 hypothetical protein [Mariniblastus sp.]